MATPIVDVMNRIDALDKEHGRAMPQAHRLILLKIAHHLGKNAYAYPSVPTLACFACSERRMTRRYLRDLEQAGWIKTSRRSFGGDSSSSGYELTPANGKPIACRIRGGGSQDPGSSDHGVTEPGGVYNPGVTEPGGGGAGTRGWGSCNPAVGVQEPPEQIMEQVIEQVSEQNPAASVGGAPPDGDAGGSTDLDVAPLTQRSVRQPEGPSADTKESAITTGGPWELCDGDPDEPLPPPEPPLATAQPPSGEAMATRGGRQTVMPGLAPAEAQPEPAAPKAARAARRAKPRGRQKVDASETKPPKRDHHQEYAEAYAAGQKDATGEPYDVPTNKKFFYRVLQTYALDEHGQPLRGEAVLAWLRASSRDYRIAKASKWEYEVGFEPAKWRAWLRAGRPMVKAQKQNVKQPAAPNAVAAVIRLTDEEYAQECPL
jgi:hypothetical protein